jgi:two-component system chemotaxis response regulator CheY
MSLLIADGSSTVRRTIRNTLTPAGITGFLEAESGRHALAMLNRQPFDVLLIGSRLDDMTGLEFAAQIRALPAYRRTPLLMVSDLRSHEDVLQAVDAGIDHYILIPFPEDLLVDKVRKALEKAVQLTAAANAARRTNIHRLYHRG